LREALPMRTPIFPAADVRVLELRVGELMALAASNHPPEPHQRDEVEALLRANTMPYARDLLARLPPR